MCSNAQGILLAAAAKTRLAVLDARSGAVLASLDSAGLVNHGAALSSDGRLCAAATFTADVKVPHLHMIMRWQWHAQLEHALSIPSHCCTAVLAFPLQWALMLAYIFPHCLLISLGEFQTVGTRQI